MLRVLVAETVSGNAHFEIEKAEEANETEELAPETGSNGDLEPKQEDMDDGDDSQSSQRTFSYDQLKTTSGKNVPGIDLKRREVSLALYFIIIFILIVV